MKKEPSFKMTYLYITFVYNELNKKIPAQSMFKLFICL